MPTYIVLGSFTEQGLRNIKDSPTRAATVSDMAKKAGASLKDTYWTLGQYDFVAIFEAPDDVTMTALGASIGKLGNVRTQTLRAFTGAEGHTDDVAQSIRACYREWKGQRVDQVASHDAPVELKLPVLSDKVKAYGATIVGTSSITTLACSVDIKGRDASGNAFETQFNEAIRLN